jgi:hypothetical protein
MRIGRTSHESTDGEIMSQKRYVYNRNGLLVESLWMDRAGKTHGSAHCYYDSHERVFAKLLNSEAGVVMGLQLFGYGSDSKLASAVFYRDSPVPLHSLAY